ncbi:MAG: hypothetical protein LBG43_10755 [Treponema sp.]|jgi:hypothetical protein|nr:hypothetical protein [Treponema sp.]
MRETDEWLYIEEAYEPHYLDDDEEFIFPDSTYKYLIVAHNEKTYSKDSNEVAADTPPEPSYSTPPFAQSGISRAAATPSSPSTLIHRFRRLRAYIAPASGR